MLVDIFTEDFYVKERLVAKRIQQGIYYTFDLWNIIELYTDFSVEHPWTEWYGKPIEFIKRYSTDCVCADNLKQIVNHGRKFINCEKPYVLGIKEVSVKDDDRYFSHNGGYIGKQKHPEIITQFQFLKLIPKVV